MKSTDDGFELLRETDPLKWSALNGCEFIEMIQPNLIMKNDMLVIEALCHMARMAEFIRRESETEVRSGQHADA